MVPAGGPRRLPPAERVRSRLRAVAGEDVAARLPAGYQRMGRVLLLRLSEELRPQFPVIGSAWQEELGVVTVLVRTGPIAGEYRSPQVEVIAGGPTETEVVEHGVRWRFDAARLMFAAGNRTERRRIGVLVRPGETMVDLFAGIGYFAIPAARSGPSTRVRAVEKNPVAFGYLTENLRLNGVADRVEAILGDNREVPLPTGVADRVVLGFLPSAIPWVERAVGLVRAEGGWLHVHTTADARSARKDAARAVEQAVTRAGARSLEPAAAREVKPYGPGRTHVVVDVRVARSPA
ncbi:MAG TPA: class I SAM-dependent methyltransferase family protein [Thermoplasmata archaeon]|nr:class I SAM-dependent methyltransferase family protein [Thermoplasmata archaeon]